MKLQSVLPGDVFFLLCIIHPPSLFLSHTLSLRSPNAVLCLAVRRGMSEQRSHSPFMLCSLLGATPVSRPLQTSKLKEL